MDSSLFDCVSVGVLLDFPPQLIVRSTRGVEKIRSTCLVISVLRSEIESASLDDINSVCPYPVVETKSNFFFFLKKIKQLIFSRILKHQKLTIHGLKASPTPIENNLFEDKETFFEIKRMIVELFTKRPSEMIMKHLCE